MRVELECQVVEVEQKLKQQFLIEQRNRELQAQEEFLERETETLQHLEAEKQRCYQECQAKVTECENAMQRHLKDQSDLLEQRLLESERLTKLKIEEFRQNEEAFTQALHQQI